MYTITIIHSINVFNLRAFEDVGMNEMGEEKKNFFKNSSEKIHIFVIVKYVTLCFSWHA